MHNVYSPWYLRFCTLLNPSGFSSLNPYQNPQVLLIMVITNGHTTPQHHRQNRRRERPGSRTRRTLNHKTNLHFNYTEGIQDALDTSVPLPSDKTRPSPLLRQNFDQSWQRWKARQQAEEKALMIQEQLRLFGGDLDEDVSLIPDETMLSVVFRLFGDIDYIDP
jgi:hypothetical protein